MANYTVSANQLREGQIVLVKGKTTFSRLAQLVQGEALARSDAQRVSNGMQPVGRPHTSVNLAHAEVLFQDPANKTVEEVFVEERRYTSKKNPQHGMCYGIDNKSDRLPAILKLDENGKAVQIQPEGELASDIEVILVLRVYKPRNYSNRGLSLDQVIIQDTEVKYFGTVGATNEALAAVGIVYAAPVVQQQAAAAPAPTASSSDPQIAAAQAAGAWPTPGADAPAAAPVSEDPFRSAPAPAETQAPAAAPAAPAQEDPQAQIEALQKQLAAAQAAATAQQAAGSPFGQSGPITYTGEE